jgi:Tol biopolymer transport system component
LSSDGSRVAAIVSPDFGKWTIAVNDRPWPKLFSDMVLAPVFSPDGQRVAAIVKDKDRWTVAVDGVPLKESFEMIWDPVFSPCGQQVLAMAEDSGRFVILANGRKYHKQFQKLWNPVFSPDGRNVLLKFIEDDKYCRQVVPVEELLG